MHSLAPNPVPSQAPATRSIAAIRHQATVVARARWSARLIMRATSASRALGTERGVLMVLLLMADGAALVSAGVAEIAALAGVSLRECHYNLRHLRELGDISISTRGGGKGKKNTYRLDVLDRLPADGGDAA